MPTQPTTTAQSQTAYLLGIIADIHSQTSTLEVYKSKQSHDTWIEREGAGRQRERERDSSAQGTQAAGMPHYEDGIVPSASQMDFEVRQRSQPRHVALRTSS